tara:strand:+ start:12 stop:383 length:372 start_codon:yes stop_codon:yes gene_type:complete
MLIALLTLMLLGGDSYDLTEFIAEGQSNMAVAVEDPKRRQTALDILAEMEQTMTADKADTAALIARTQADFNEEKVWTAEELDALFAQARALRAERAEHFIGLRLKLRRSLNDGEWAAAFPES